MKCWFAALLWAGASVATAADGFGRVEFADRRDPPPYTGLNSAQREAYELGHAIFNTPWVIAGTPRAGRRDGLGPLFNGATCDGCHNEGARAQGASGDELTPIGLIVQLGSPAAQLDLGDPVYGHVLNTSAIEGYAPEARVRVRYVERAGRYADGAAWTLRAPRIELDALAYGALASDTLIKPRLASALFGVGLLQAVPDAAIVEIARRQAGVEGQVAWREVNGLQRVGRFGWQADAVSIEDQTARAFSREMGLGSTPIPHDDCTAAQSECRKAADGGRPEVTGEFLAALVSFQQWLAVPGASASQPQDGAALFAATGCAACHRPQLPVENIVGAEMIAPYTDLLLHDLGAGLADRTLGGKPGTSRWRTAPLWGLNHVPRSGRAWALLHDGRARSVEEAVLWHDGEAAAARRRFEKLDASRRQRLSSWVEGL